MAEKNLTKHCVESMEELWRKCGDSPDALKVGKEYIIPFMTINHRICVKELAGSEIIL